MLFEKRRMAKQVKVETWLDLTQMLKELGVEKIDAGKPKTVHDQMSYIV